MNDNLHAVLCVDDEKNILNSLKRLLRKEGYRLFTASSGEDAFAILEDNDVNLVLCDQRMPGMSGTEFLAIVKKQYPDVIRIILTGYTEVNAITESINQGHIYKFFLKPWNDQNLKLEIKQALDQYDLICANKKLHKEVLEKNSELREINENLEIIVEQRTEVLEIQNQALELSRAILEDIPIPVLGLSAEGMVVLINNATRFLTGSMERIELGKNIKNYFSCDIVKELEKVMETETPLVIKGTPLSGIKYDADLIPLSGRFRGKGVVMTLSAPGG